MENPRRQPQSPYATPQVPPPIPTLEECIAEALDIINQENQPPSTESSSRKVKTALHTCPIEWCGKEVARLWNNLNKVQKKHGMTGKFITYVLYCCLYCIVLSLVQFTPETKFSVHIKLRRRKWSVEE